MKGLMMDYQLTLPTILRRAETLFGKKEIVTCLPDRSIHRYTYHDFAVRAKKLSNAFKKLGIQNGDRVATLSWNHYQHMEVYYAAPCTGAVVHPLNIRFSGEDLSYIVNHAGDKLIIVDQVLLPLFEKFKYLISVSKVVVIKQTNEPLAGDYLDYEDLMASGEEAKFEPFEGDENTAAFMCYTSGTTGKPKGIVYSHRSIMLHTMSFLLSCNGIDLRERDVVLPIVPMFHACAWGFPYNCAFIGATQVFPGPYLDAESLLTLIEAEKVTLTGGVPTVMLNILHKLDSDPHKYKLSLRTVVLGGSSAPRFLIKSFTERYGIPVLNSWGMTELSPLGATSVINSITEQASADEQYDHHAKLGLPIPLVEVRARNEDGLINWDGDTMGELEVRGPFVAASYYGEGAPEGKFTPDGWLKTGDIASINQDGYIQIRDRSKDVIKSGGEWISSVALENALMEHPCIREAAVIAVPDNKWIERPYAYVVPKDGKTISPDELKQFLSAHFAKFWIPDEYVVIDAIPKTSVGKFLKSALRERYDRERGND